MNETRQPMTEFTHAPGEAGFVGRRFIPSVVIF